MSVVARAAIACALIVAASLPPLAASPAAPGGLATKTFTIHYRQVDDVVALIQPEIGERGSYSVHPKIRSVTVTDAPETLQRIEELIAGFDLPPRGISLVVQLMRAEEGAPSPAPQAPGRRLGLPPAVIQDLTKWGVITPIGSASVATAENEEGSVSMGDVYRLRFTVGAVSPHIGVIRIERFVLERLQREEAGASGPQRPVPLMDLVLNLKAGQTTVLGATSSQDSKQALFVSVTATTVEP